MTITKSITIFSEGLGAGVFLAGTKGVVVNAASTDVVILRGLDIEGLGTGLGGITVLGNLKALHVEKCTINNFRGANASGIEIATSVVGTTQVFIKDTIVRNNGQGTGGGIFMNSTGSAIVKASLDNVRMENNIFGLKCQGTSTCSVNNSVAAGNSAAGFSAFAGTAVLNIERSVSANNGTGLVCNAGTTVRIGNSSIFGNTTAVTTGGSCFTFKNVDSDATIVPPFIQGSPQ